MKNDYDVVVVGARCAGAATALLLARGGLSVLVVDRARPGTDTLSTHALTRPGVLALHRWGVLDAVRAAGTPPVRRVVQHYSDSARTPPHRTRHGAWVVDVPIRAAGGVDALYAPRRWLLDRLLGEAAAAAGAEVAHGVTARDLLVDGDRVAGVRIGGRGGDVPVRAGFVVGADGVRSGVARRVAAPVVQRGRHATDTVYTYVDGLPDDAYRNWFVPGAAAGLIPTNNGRACVWVGGPAGLRWPGTRADRLADILAAVAPDLARGLAARSMRGPHPAYAGPPGFTRRVHGPGWALVGDAAHYTDPIGAHGMTAALVGAELLARSLLTAAGGVPEAVALAGYARTHRRLTEPMAAAVDLAASHRWDAAGLQRAHLAMNEAMRAEWSHLISLGALVPAPPATAVNAHRAGRSTAERRRMPSGSVPPAPTCAASACCSSSTTASTSFRPRAAC